MGLEASIGPVAFIYTHSLCVRAVKTLACAAASLHWRLINNKISIQTSHEPVQSLNKSAMLVYIELVAPLCYICVGT